MTSPFAARVSFAAGAAAVAGAASLLAGGVGGSAIAATLLACAARAASSGARLGAGPVTSALAARSLERQSLFAPAWAFALAAGIARAGSADLADIRGANAVAGLALAHGRPAAVAGAWLALAAGALALAGPGFGPVRTAGSRGRSGIVRSEPLLGRLEMLALAAQGALLATLFAGPQATRGLDAVVWVAALAGIGGVVALTASVAPRGVSVLARSEAPAVAAALGASGLALVLAGGVP